MNCHVQHEEPASIGRDESAYNKNEAQKKRVLVIGASSYIGDGFAKYAKGRLYVDIVDSYEGWKTAPFEEYDTVLMVAGLAHQKWTRKQRRTNKDLYFAINRDLAVAVAKKAKAGGIKQFIYLSSMAVYGQTEGEISADTKPVPRNSDYYGLSKYQAEEALISVFRAKADKPLHCPDSLCIIRPPMVYGPGCPGKFSALVKVAKTLPFIPNIKNRRSMIYIDNLSELLCIAAEQGVTGILQPHNKEYVNTAWLLAEVAKVMGNRRWILPGLGLLVKCAMPFSSAAKTAFGCLYYTMDATQMPFDDDYQLVSTHESVEISAKL